MIETIIKGFIIGFLIASPMGPINMLVVQRTLSRGYRHGLVTGLGALLSDLIYAFVTLMGLSLVSDLLEKNELIFQSVGGAVLVIFGYIVFRTNPLKGWRPDILPQKTRYVKDFISSFFLTLSNAAIIFVIITLYSRFAFNPIADGPAYLTAAILSITFGNFSWWYFFTAFLSRFRKHFNRRGLVLLNRVVGSILIVIGIGGIVMTLFSKQF
ncbi:MAG TPA: lysine transporter LysE [Porphyromonadaceae bacterium]|nr:lysine transporter LysE [Porphyromonadaceae bacterium]